MRIKKFRHQAFQPFPSSISNKRDSCPNLIFSNKKEYNTQNCKNILNFTATTWEILLFSTQFITPQKASNKSESEQLGLSEGHAVVRYLHRSPETKARKIRAHFDTSVTSEPPGNPTSRSITAGAAETPSPLVAGALMSQCHQVLMTAGDSGSGWAVSTGESRSGSSPCQTSQVTPQNYSLSLPLRSCTTRNGFTVIDYSEYTKIPRRIPKNFVSSSAERKPRTREMGNETKC